MQKFRSFQSLSLRKNARKHWTNKDLLAQSSHFLDHVSNYDLSSCRCLARTKYDDLLSLSGQFVKWYYSAYFITNASFRPSLTMLIVPSQPRFGLLTQCFLKYLNDQIKTKCRLDFFVKDLFIFSTTIRIYELSLLIFSDQYVLINDSREFPPLSFHFSHHILRAKDRRGTFSKCVLNEHFWSMSWLVLAGSCPRVLLPISRTASVFGLFGGALCVWQPFPTMIIQFLSCLFCIWRIVSHKAFHNLISIQVTLAIVWAIIKWNYGELSECLARTGWEFSMLCSIDQLLKDHVVSPLNICG